MSSKKKRPKTRPASGGHALDRGYEPPELNRARELLRRGDFAAALDRFEQARRRYPKSIPALIETARAYAGRHRIDRAGPLLEQAEGLSGRNAEAYFQIGESYRAAGLLKQAARSYRTALRIAERAPRALLELASIEERLGDVDEATRLVERLLRESPGYAPARLLKGRLSRRRGDSVTAESALRSVAETAALPPALRAEALGELATLAETNHDHQTAWQAITNAKAILLPHASAAIAAATVVRQRFERLNRSVTANDPVAWDRNAPEPAHRLALLTGFPRSGTTLLEQVLDSHPNVVSCEERDILATPTLQALHAGAAPDVELTQLLRNPAPGAVESAREVYQTTLAAAIGEPAGNAEMVLLDKNPALTPMAPIYLRLFPHARILFVVRDPRDVLLSCFLRYLPINPVSANFLTLELAAEKLASDLEGWLEVRRRLGGRYLEVRYEDAVQDLPAAARAMVDFLNLPWDDQVLAYRERRDRVVLSPTYEAVAKPVYRSAIGRWKRYEAQLTPVLPRLEHVIEAFGYPAR